MNIKPNNILHLMPRDQYTKTHKTMYKWWILMFRKKEIENTWYENGMRSWDWMKIAWKYMNLGCKFTHISSIVYEYRLFGFYSKVYYISEFHRNSRRHVIVLLQHLFKFSNSYQQFMEFFGNEHHLNIQ